MDYINTSEAARLIGVSRGTILNYIRAGDFADAYVLSARKTVFLRQDVIDWMKSKVRAI